MKQRLIITFVIATVIFSFSTFAANVPYQYTKVEGRTLLVDFDRDGNYKSYFIRGVGYSPMPVGRHPSDWGWPAGDARPSNIYDDPQILNRDFQLLHDLKANTIRIWKGNDTMDGMRFPNKMTQATLNRAEAHGLKVIAGFWINIIGERICTTGGAHYQVYIDVTNPSVRTEIINRFRNYVIAFKDHPAILFWAIGNENNNQLNTEDANQIRAWYSLVDEMAAAAHAAEGAYYHPVAVVNGDLQFIGDSNLNTADVQLPHVDIWGANVYRGISFGNLFDEFQLKSSKPLWISEFGIDAWQTTLTANPDVGFEDQTTQASWDVALWREIAQHNTQTIGGTVMEYSDEWWKPYEFICGNGNPACNAAQNHFGFGPQDTNCPADGVPDLYPPAPDQYINEEWLGIVKIQANGNNNDIVIPREVYYKLQSEFQKTDLVLTQVSIDPTDHADSDIFNLNPGDSVHLKATVENKGDFDAGPFKVKFYVGGHALDEIEIPILRSHETQTVLSQAVWNIPITNPTQNQTRVTYHFGARVDSGYQVNEILENNNLIFKLAMVKYLSNRPPVFTPSSDKTIALGDLLQFIISASDPEVKPLRLTAQLASGDLLSTIGANFVDLGNGTGYFYWTPTGPIGIYPIVFKAIDNEGLMAELRILITVVADLRAPFRFNGAPRAELPYGTTEVTVSLNTDENAICKYDFVAGKPFENMQNQFANTNALEHSQIVQVASGDQKTFYVRCQDDFGNTNLSDYSISFSVRTLDVTVPTTPSNLRAYSLSRFWVQLFWDPSFDSGGYVLYRVARAEKLGEGQYGPEEFISPLTFLPTWGDINVEPAKTYRYRVIAYDSSPAHNASQYSLPVEITVQSEF